MPDKCFNRCAMFQAMMTHSPFCPTQRTPENFSCEFLGRKKKGLLLHERLERPGGGVVSRQGLIETYRLHARPVVMTGHSPIGRAAPILSCSSHRVGSCPSILSTCSRNRTHSLRTSAFNAMTPNADGQECRVGDPRFPSVVAMTSGVVVWTATSHPQFPPPEPSSSPPIL